MPSLGLPLPPLAPENSDPVPTFRCAGKRPGGPQGAPSVMAHLRAGSVQTSRSESEKAVGHAGDRDCSSGGACLAEVWKKNIACKVPGITKWSDGPGVSWARK